MTPGTPNYRDSNINILRNIFIFRSERAHPRTAGRGVPDRRPAEPA